MKQTKLCIGEIKGTFGIKGELKVYSESDFVDYRYRIGAKVVLSNGKEYEITSFRMHKGNVLITLNHLYDINQVLDKIGMKIYTTEEEIPPLGEDEYYVDQLIGLNVKNTEDVDLGKVTDVIEIPSGYILEIIDEKNKRFLLPFVDEFVKSITDNEIIIEEIEGIRT